MERRLGVVLDSFRQPPKEALESAAALGFRQIEMSAVSGPVDPTELTGTGRRHLLRYVGGLGLRLAALGGDLGGSRFAESSRVEQRLEKLRSIVEMAADLRVPVVTTHLGRVDEQILQRGYLLEVIDQLATLSDRTGTYIAFETGGANPALLSQVLNQIGAGTLGVCYDPASLLIDGFDALEGIGPLANTILIARARDALAGSARQPGREVPLGSGQIDFAGYLAALDQAGYRSVPFVRRTDPEHPAEELADAKRRLEQLLG